MQIGQQNASIAAYNSQTSVNLSSTEQQAAPITAANTAPASKTDTANLSPLKSTVVTISPEAQALAAGEVVINIGNGTGKPPLET